MKEYKLVESESGEVVDEITTDRIPYINVKYYGNKVTVKFMLKKGGFWELDATNKTITNILTMIEVNFGNPEFGEAEKAEVWVKQFQKDCFKVFEVNNK